MGLDSTDQSGRWLRVARLRCRAGRIASARRVRGAAEGGSGRPWRPTLNICGQISYKDYGNIRPGLPPYPERAPALGTRCGAHPCPLPEMTPFVIGRRRSNMRGGVPWVARTTGSRARTGTRADQGASPVDGPTSADPVRRFALDHRGERSSGREGRAPSLAPDPFLGLQAIPGPPSSTPRQKAGMPA